MQNSPKGTAAYQLWKLEPPTQTNEIIVHSNQSVGGGGVIEDIGAHENDFDMMLYDEPNSAPEPQNGTDVVTEKGLQKKVRSFMSNL